MTPAAQPGTRLEFGPSEAPGFRTVSLSLGQVRGQREQNPQAGALHYGLRVRPLRIQVFKPSLRRDTIRQGPLGGEDVVRGPP